MLPASGSPHDATLVTDEQYILIIALNSMTTQILELVPMRTKRWNTFLGRRLQTALAILCI